jgi:hypothetical protein
MENINMNYNRQMNDRPETALNYTNAVNVNPERAPEINEQLGYLGTKIHQLGESLNVLENRLSPVLMDRPDVKKEHVSEPRQSVYSPLGRALQDYISTLEAHIEKIHTLQRNIAL